ncbi:MAG TPA: phosphatase PAP2 family protein [Casimicrobium huifangae]|nr:phosphatase PAP2 family protein [Casimicrobium huifangae]
MSQIARARSIIFDLCTDVDFDVRGETFVLMTRAFDRAGAAQAICTIARPSDANFAEQARLVEAWAVLRPERVPEILDQMDVPMGLWASVMDLNSTTTPHTLALIDVCIGFAAHVVHRIKHSLGTARPVMFSPYIQPIRPTPRFGALPSGHATEAFVVSELLKKLIGCRDSADSAAKVLDAYAERIATNRVVAGFHFPVDSMAGCMLGTCLIDYVQRLATPDAVNFSPYQFVYTGANPEFDPEVWRRPPKPSDAGAQLGDIEGKSIVVAGLGSDHAKTSSLSALWEAAANEWR